MKYKNMREEELKNKVGVDWFKDFDHKQSQINHLMSVSKIFSKKIRLIEIEVL